MASGLPDYYRGMDITFQTLAHITNRPKYGAGQAAIAEEVVIASDVTSLVLVTGKGVIYGGVVTVVHTESQKNSGPIFKIDGVQLVFGPFSIMRFYGFTAESCYLFYLLQYDEVGFRYTVGISKGFTFETSFEILYRELHGAAPTVQCGMFYALI